MENIENINWFIRAVQENYANFEGRARRKEYWNFILWQMIILLPFYILGLATIQMRTLSFIFFGVYYVLALALFIPTIAVLVRRLHDTGKPTWMVVLGFLPVVNFLVLYWLVLDSEVGPNDFGPDPKAGEPGH